MVYFTCKDGTSLASEIYRFCFMEKMPMPLNQLARGGRIFPIAVEKIIPNRHQPRTIFRENELQGLAASIAANGIIQPLCVRPTGECFELISGERRLRAAKMVGLHTVPCIICDADDKNSAVYALIENIQRSDLHYFEEAEALRNLLQLFEISQSEAALILGRSQSSISNKIRLLRIPGELREQIIRHGLSERHARSLLRYQTDDAMKKALREICLHGLSAEQAEKAPIESFPVKTQQEKENNRRQRAVFKNIRIFLNTFNHAVDIMRNAGIDAGTDEEETDDYYIYTVKIPKTIQSRDKPE